MTAHFITPDSDLDGAPTLHGEVRLEQGHGDIRRATLHLTALGLVEARLNGRPVGDEVLAPGWSSYEWRLRVRAHDVTDLLADTNAVEMLLGNGWYRGRIGFAGQRAVYGDELAGYARFEIEYADGHVQQAGTDTAWTAGPSTTTSDDLLDGQSIDADRDLTRRVGVRVVPTEEDRLVVARTPPVQRLAVLEPVQIWTSASGRTLLDFGENLVGWLRLRVRGPRGTIITARHAEVLEDGELCVRTLRTALATDTFRCSGGDDVFEPTFTTHGFRYAELTGWPGELASADLGAGAVEAVVIGSAMARVGSFRCSDDRLNALHDNVARTWRGNSVGLPTDCPQRDERLGWTGDLALFVSTAAYLFDVDEFLRDWLRDLAVEQVHADGRPPLMAPDPLKYVELPGMPPIDVAAIWGDASVWVPWTLYETSGDPQVLRDQWPSMTAYVDRAVALLSARGLWEDGFQFGDWLDPTTPPDQPFAARADPGVVATACLVRSLDRMAQAAAVVGADTTAYAERAAALRAAFDEHYVGADGRVRSDCPTVYALAIGLDVLAPHLLAGAGARLAELVRADGHHAGTGFAGTPFVLDALARTGHLDDAYRLLLQTESPSWLAQVELGATTVWERWDSLLPDGSVNSGEMTGFSHYPLASVGDWLHRSVGGLTPLDPGYRRVLIDPRPGGGLTWAETTHLTPYGEIRVTWRAADGELVDLEVTAPPEVEVVSRRGAGSARR